MREGCSAGFDSPSSELRGERRGEGRGGERREEERSREESRGEESRGEARAQVDHNVRQGRWVGREGGRVWLGCVGEGAFSRCRT